MISLSSPPIFKLALSTRRSGVEFLLPKIRNVPRPPRKTYSHPQKDRNRPISRQGGDFERATGDGQTDSFERGGERNEKWKKRERLLYD
jgi:hypothetical protein